MSAKLEKAIAMKQVLVKKVVSGEVRIHFSDKNLKPITLSHNGVMDLLSRRGVTVEAIRGSNLKELITNGYVQVV
jgi:hypothetical protein